MNIPQLSRKELLALKIKYGATAVANRIKTIKNSTLHLIKDGLDVEILHLIKDGLDVEVLNR